MTQPLIAGILSDTHLTEPDDHFRRLVEICFAEAEVILHAGDLTDLSVLEVFDDRTVHAVRGNMCRPSACQRLPDRKIVTLGRFKIGLIHRAGWSYDFEDQLLPEFDEMVDCIVYGHTHRPVCHQSGGVLYINPGSFQATGRHGACGTYALLTIGDELLARIHHVPRLAPRMPDQGCRISR
ncbi:MAG: metallophosphoesterase family protein [Thermodesulfobacteriota bacterium]